MVHDNLQELLYQGHWSTQVGKKIKLGSLHPTRDFNYVEDTVNGFISTLDNYDVFGEVINLSSNFEISIGDTAKIIAKIMCEDIEIVTENQRLRPKKSEVERLLGNNSKAKKLLNWYPKYSEISGFRLGLQKTIDWFIRLDNLKKYKTNRYNI